MKVIHETMDMLHQRLGYVPDEWLLSYARVSLNREGERRLTGGRLDTLLPEPTKDNFAGKRLRTVFMSALFAMSAVFISLFASLRWNRRITWNMLRIQYGWIRSHSLSLLRRLS